MIDFHTHILPDIDDGSSSVEESVRLVELLAEQGVNKIVLTPHFYAYRSSIERFSEKRSAALKTLTSALKEKQLNIDIYIGCEVLFFDELWRVDDVKEFCVKGTNYILIEMPFASWENSMVECVINLINRGFCPVLAHFERYIVYKGNMAKIREMTRAGALVQMNCDYINNFFTRGKALRFIKNGSVFAFGSDCHNLDNRKPDFGRIEELLCKKIGKKNYEKIIKQQEMIIRGATKVYPE